MPLRPNPTSRAAPRSTRPWLRRGLSEDLAARRHKQARQLGAQIVERFQLWANGFLLSPVRASRVLSCLVDPSDLSGLVDRITISGPSVKFLIDNARSASAPGPARARALPITRRPICKKDWANWRSSQKVFALWLARPAIWSKMPRSIWKRGCSIKSTPACALSLTKLY